MIPKNGRFPAKTGGLESLITVLQNNVHVDFVQSDTHECNILYTT